MKAMRPRRHLDGKTRACLVVALVIFSLLLLPTPTYADYPTLDYYVNDYTYTLTTEESFAISDLCSFLYEETGAELVVLIVGTTAPDDIDYYALKTFEKNGLGQEGEDNGILLVVALDDETWRVEMGYGLEGYLPDSKVGYIAETYLIPTLSQGDYFEGIFNTVDALAGEVYAEYQGSPPPEPDYPISWLPLTWFQLTLVLTILVAVFVLTGGRLFLFLPGLVLSLFGKNGGGGRSGGGGASGRWR